MAAPDPREMYSEIGALLGAIAQAFSITEAEVITGVEQKRLTMAFGRDENGNPFVTATLDGRAARIYQGAIKRDPATEKAP
jgi:hypothetical protein